MHYGTRIAAVCFTSLLCLAGPHMAEVHAIDYILEWNFDEPLGSQSPPEWYARDFLIYDVRTGELKYEVGERREERWAPPDVVSASGAFRTTEPLEPVPLGSFDSPRFEFDETVAGEIVEGSNSIRIRYDNLRFWPWSPDDPHILQQWGLDALPTSYEFGQVLPPGLSRELLLADLHAATAAINLSYVELVYVVPEPTSIGLVAAVLIAVLLARQWRIRNANTNLLRASC